MDALHGYLPKIGKKTRWESTQRAILNKSWKQHPLKTAAVRPLTSNLINHPNKMIKICREPLEKQGQTHKRRSISYTSTCQCWLTSKDLNQLCVNTGCTLENLPGVMDDREGWQERIGELCAVYTT